MSTSIAGQARRIITNFMRLGATLLAGLLLVRLLIEFGPGGYAVVALLQTTIGYLRMFPDILVQSVVHDLADADHTGAPDDLASTFVSALTICAALGVAIGLATAGFALALNVLFTVPAELLGAARLLAICIGVQSLAIALSTPSMALLAVRGRFAAVNFWTTGQRWTLTIAAALVLATLPDRVADALAHYALLSTVLFCCWQAVAVTVIHRAAPMPLRGARPTLARCRSMLGLGGWAGAVNLSVVGQTVFGAALMNQAFGVAGNAAYSIAIQLGGYIRMAANGMAMGLEAVSAEFTRTGDALARRRIVHYAALANAWAAMAALPVVVLHAPAWLKLWLGEPGRDPGLDHATIALLVIAFAIGSTFFGIVDSWRKVLVGAGQARAWGLATATIIVLALPVAALVTWYGPAPVRLYGPSLPFTLFLPVLGTLAYVEILRHWSGATRAALLAPVLRAVVTAGGAAAIAMMLQPLLPAGLTGALTGSVLYLMIYLPLSLVVLIDAPLRARLLARLQRPGPRR